MHTRSRGSENLMGYQDNITRFDMQGGYATSYYSPSMDGFPQPTPYAPQGHYAHGFATHGTSYVPIAPPTQDYELLSMVQQILHEQAACALMVNQQLDKLNTTLDAWASPLDHTKSILSPSWAQGESVINPPEVCNVILADPEFEDKGDECMDIDHVKEVDEIYPPPSPASAIAPTVPLITTGPPEAKPEQPRSKDNTARSLHKEARSPLADRSIQGIMPASATKPALPPPSPASATASTAPLPAAEPTEVTLEPKRSPVLIARSPQHAPSIQGTNAVAEPKTDVLPPYQPPLPFPSQFLTKAQKKVIKAFQSDMKEIGVNLPNMATMQEAHLQMQLIRDVLAHQDKVAALFAPPDDTPPAAIAPTSIPKLADQGQFTLPCSLGDLQLKDALVDSGASINLISLGMVRKLGITTLTETSSPIMFGDASSKSPLGIIIDYPLRIGACRIPIDLHVMEMVNQKKVPLILGRPFLTTAGATIDFPKQKVILHNVDGNTSYPLTPPLPTYCGTITLEKLDRPLELDRFHNDGDRLHSLFTEHMEGAQEGEVCDSLNVSPVKKKKVKVLESEFPEPDRGDHLNFEGASLNALFNEHTEGAQMGEVCDPFEATLDQKKKKKRAKEPPNPPCNPSPPTLSLVPLKLKDGQIEYKVKCKGQPKPFSSAKAIVPTKLQGDPSKLQELLSKVLTITLSGRPAFNPP